MSRCRDRSHLPSNRLQALLADDEALVTIDLPLPASLIQLDQRTPASPCGVKNKLLPTSAAGRLVRANAFGWTCFSIPGSVAATPCGSGGNTYAMARQRSGRKRPILRSRCRSYLYSPRRCAPVPAAILLSSSVQTESRSTSVPSAINFGRRVVRPACNDLHMGSAKSPRHARLMLARRSRNWKRSSDGPAAAWRRSTHAPPIDVSSHNGRCISSRTMSELLFPHL